MRELEGRVAVVTGAGAGIGRDVALRLARDGCDLGLFDIDAASVEETAAMVRAVGVKADVVVGNVSAQSDANHAVERWAVSLGPIDILVNNAGILQTARFLEVTVDDWRRTFAINLDGVFFFCQAVLPTMVERGAGVLQYVGHRLEDRRAGLFAAVPPGQEHCAQALALRPSALPRGALCC